MENDFVDLLTLQRDLQEGIEDLFPDRVRVRAEVSSVSVKGGHCYLELCQSEKGRVVAKVRAVVWRDRYFLLSAMFREETGSDLQPGMTILAGVRVSYHEVFGLTLIVEELDPGTTLGEQERIRRETIAKLEEEGLIDRQKSLSLPALPYRLAVISTDTAAGWGDFRHHLLDNEYGFRFQVDLFEAKMQGEGAPASISDALDTAVASKDPYDAILILRGGGSNFDLACFDDYGLCFNIANCDIPVLTAIGHERDRHVADLVACRDVKTPTALADLLLDIYIGEDEMISGYVTRLRLAFVNKINAMSSRIELLSSRIKAADPRGILSRGFALATDARGIILKSAAIHMSHSCHRIQVRWWRPSPSLMDTMTPGQRE